MAEDEPTRRPSEVDVPFSVFLGPWPERVELEVEHLEQVDCGSYVREKVSYAVAEAQRVCAYVCIPKGAAGAMPAVFCHHQHAGDFSLGKTEVVGLGGDPDQAYARELAERGFITIAPDAIGFEERTAGASPTGSSLSLRHRARVHPRDACTCLRLPARPMWTPNDRSFHRLDPAAAS